MLRKRIFKISSVLVAVIIAFSCFCISASADSLGISINSISDFFELDDVQLKVALSDSPIDNAEGWQTITLDKGVTGMNWNCLTVGVSGDETHIKNNVWQIKCTLKVKDKYIQKGFSSGSFYITVNDTNYSRYRIFEPTWTDGFKLLKLDSNCTYEGDVVYRSNQKIICNIPEETVPDTFNRVQVIFFITNKKTISAGELLYFNFSDLKLNMYNESDKLAYTITQNQNENTDKIIANQNENADEIKNGWQQENEIDSSATDDYAAKDKELQAATDQGRSEAVSVFNSFGSLFQSDGHLYKGLLSVSAMFTEFMKIDWLSSLLNFSLAIGIFAFVIGTGSSVFKSAHEKHEYSKERKYMASENSQARREMND